MINSWPKYPHTCVDVVNMVVAVLLVVVEPYSAFNGEIRMIFCQKNCFL